MAINETIVTGRKFRKLIDEATKLWQRISFWGVATDVEFDDGENAETKFGAISGITDSLTSTSSNVAASAAAVKALNDKIVELNSDLGSIYYLGTGTSFDLKAKFPDRYQDFIADNFIVGITGMGACGGQVVREMAENSCGRAEGFSLKKDYSSTSGILTISGNTQQVGGYKYPNWVTGTSVQSGATFAYLVIGKIN